MLYCVLVEGHVGYSIISLQNLIFRKNLCGLVQLMSTLDQVTKIIEPHSMKILGLVVFLFIISIILIILNSKKATLEKIISAPFSVICSLFCALILGLVYWIVFTGRSYGDLIYLLTFVVISLYTYYTLQVVKFAYKGPALLHVQERHSDVLKSFLNNWSSSISHQHISLENVVEHPVDAEEFYFVRSIEIFKSFEEGWEYRDLLDYHLPKSHKDLEEHWKNFIESLERLGGAVNKLYDSINDEINQELAKVSREYPDLGSVEPNVLRELNDLLYLTCISAHEYEIKLNVEDEIIHEGEDCYRLDQLVLSFNRDKNKLPFGPFKLVSGPYRKEIEFAKAQIEKILKDDYLERKHASVIAEIKEYEAEMKRKKNEFKNEIDELAKWPLLPGRSCDRIKDFDIKI